MFSFAVYQFIILPAADRQANTELSLKADDIRHSVQDYFSETEQHLFLLRSFAAQGFFLSDDTKEFFRFVMPLLQHNPD